MIKHEEIINLILRDENLLTDINNCYYFTKEEVYNILQYITEQEKKDELLEQLQGNTLRNRNLILETSNKLLKEDLETKNKLLDLYRELHDTYRYPTWKNEKDVQCILKEIKALEEELK